MTSQRTASRPTGVTFRSLALAGLVVLGAPVAGVAGIDGPGTVYEVSGRDGEDLTQDQSFRFTPAEADFGAAARTSLEVVGAPVELQIWVRPNEKSIAWRANLNLPGPVRLGHTYTAVGGDQPEQLSTLTLVSVDSRGCQPHQGSVRVDAYELGPPIPDSYAYAVRFLDATFTQSCYQNNAQHSKGVLSGHIVLNNRAAVPPLASSSAPATRVPRASATTASPGTVRSVRAAPTTAPATVRPGSSPTSTLPSASAPLPTGSPLASLTSRGEVATAVPSTSTVAEPVAQERSGRDDGVPWWGWAVLAAALAGALGGSGLAVRRLR